MKTITKTIRDYIQKSVPWQKPGRRRKLFRDLGQY